MLDNPASEWTLNPAGVLNLINDNAEATLLAGNAINLNGSLFVTGDVRTTARLDVEGTVSIVTPGEPLRLAGGGFANDNTLVGGTINGPGLLSADTGKALRGFGVINAGVDFDGSAALIAEGGTLAVNGSLIDVGTAEALAGGVLNVANAWNTTVADAVLVVGGELKGGTVTIGGAPVVGRGLVSARVVNDVGINGNGGTLVVQTAANDNDWDGAAGSGSLTATGLGSVLELRDNATFGFTGSVNASATGRVFANGFALDYNAGSILQLQDGVYEATHGTGLGGSVVTLAGSTSQSTLKVAANQPLTFEAASVTTLGQNLRLENNSIEIAAGATFGGAGSLMVPDGSRLTTAAGATINVPLQNDGDLQLSGPAVVGLTVVRDYQQSSAGDLFVDLGGTLFSQYDRLAATGSATLSGVLHVNIAGAFSPTIGQTFNVVSATAGRTGQFSSLDVAGMPLGLALRVDYFPTTVQLLVVPAATMAADFNRDGAVDGGDLTVWKQAFGVSGLADASGDGRSDGADFLAWQRGLSIGSPATFSTIAVPEPRGLAVVAILSLAVRSRRHRRGLTAC